MTDWECTYKDLKKRNWVVLLILACPCFFFFDRPFTFGVILGGFISIANFSFLQLAICKAFSGETRIKAKTAILCFVRLSGLVVIIYILITRQIVNPVGFTVGFSTVVISIVSYGISMAMKTGIERTV
ncbi:MAG: ATP synthase subunit I [Deltaproteobacteria bacterium]|nr:ATP synthase subunit I [Deltaproteobacteria bacterium]